MSFSLAILLTLLTLTCSNTVYKGISSVNGSWDTFKRDDQLRHHETLSHYVIVLEPGSSAQIYCNSEDMIPRLALSYTNLTASDVPKEQLLVGQNHHLNALSECEVRKLKHGPMDYWRPFTTCTLAANYSVQDVWWDCGFQFPSQTHIRVVTTPARSPFHHQVPPHTRHMEWWCLRDRHVIWTAAGHLLWLFASHVNRSRDLKNDSDHDVSVAHEEHIKLLVVERYPSWELEPGDLFECNGSVWRWADDYPCLKILPNGWPAVHHCHGIESLFMITVILVFFIFLYCNLVAVQHVYFVARDAVKRYIRRKRGPRVYIPMIPKDNKMPYRNIQDITLLQGNDKYCFVF